MAEIKTPFRPGEKTRNASIVALLLLLVALVSYIEWTGRH